MVTRAAHQASPLAQKLRQWGPRSWRYPPSPSPRPPTAAAPWSPPWRHWPEVATRGPCSPRLTPSSVFSSVSLTRACSVGRRWLRSGPGTAAALRVYRVTADLVPTDFRAEGLAASFPPAPPPPAPRRVLLPQAAGARPELRAAARPARLGGRCRRGLPDGPPGAQSRLVDGRRQGRRHLLRFFFRRQQLPRPGRVGPTTSHRRLHRAGHGGYCSFPGASGAC